MIIDEILRICHEPEFLVSAVIYPLLVHEPGSPGAVNKPPIMANINGVPWVLGFIKRCEGFLWVEPVIFRVAF